MWVSTMDALVEGIMAAVPTQLGVSLLLLFLATGNWKVCVVKRRLLPVTSPCHISNPTLIRTNAGRQNAHAHTLFFTVLSLSGGVFVRIRDTMRGTQTALLTTSTILGIMSSTFTTFVAQRKSIGLYESLFLSLTGLSALATHCITPCTPVSTLMRSHNPGGNC